MTHKKTYQNRKTRINKNHFFTISLNDYQIIENNFIGKFINKII